VRTSDKGAAVLVELKNPLERIPATPTHNEWDEDLLIIETQAYIVKSQEQ